MIWPSEWPDVPATPTASSRIDWPSRIVRPAPQPIAQPAHHRRQREHPGDVEADRQTDDLQRGAMVLHVHGRQGHDRDHHGV